MSITSRILKELPSSFWTRVITKVILKPDQPLGNADNLLPIPNIYIRPSLIDNNNTSPNISLHSITVCTPRKLLQYSTEPCQTNSLEQGLNIYKTAHYFPVFPMYFFCRKGGKVVQSKHLWWSSPSGIVPAWASAPWPWRKSLGTGKFSLWDLEVW